MVKHYLKIFYLIPLTYQKNSVQNVSGRNEEILKKHMHTKKGVEEKCIKKLDNKGAHKKSLKNII